MARSHPTFPVSRVFMLEGLPGTVQQGVIITPEPMHYEKVEIAWTHAVRYTAKGLDVPDYEAAAKKLIEFHPTWVYVPTLPIPISINLRNKQEDAPE